MDKLRRFNRNVFFVAIVVSLAFPFNLKTSHAQTSSPGLSNSRDQWFQQGRDGIFGVAESYEKSPVKMKRGDEFGRALATGDFNGDGYLDLAVGSPGEDSEGESRAVDDPYKDLKNGKGMVSVIYGAPIGLSATAGPGNQAFQKGAGETGVIGLGNSKEIMDALGAALAAGDFNGDGYSDLAIGVPGDYVDRPGTNELGRGRVYVVYGGPAGLSASSISTFHQDIDGMQGARDPGDQFGSALAAGDFNKDSYADLAIGVPGEDDNAGAVAIIYGAQNGLNAGNGPAGNQLWDQDNCYGCATAANMKGSKESGDKFGTALAVGDFNADGVDDLAIGLPWKDSSGNTPGAGVAVLMGYSGPGSTNGLHTFNDAGDQLFDHSTLGYRSEGAGKALAAGDFNGDGVDDLAVGAPSANSGGKVFVLRGQSYTVGGGLTAAGLQELKQSQNGLPGSDEDNDEFGAALAAGDFNDDGKADLAIGSPGEDKSGGAITVVYGGASGLQGANSPGAKMWYQGEGGLSDDLEGGDYLGSALTAGDFDGNGGADLAIGAYGFVNYVGGVFALYGSRQKTPRGDFDGDNKADLAVWRGQTGMWYYNGSVGGVTRSAFWGSGASPYNDVPVPADYDGDSRMDYAVWRPAEGNWYVKCSSGADFPVVNFGGPGDTLVPADYDGDGKDDIAVWRGAAGVWIIRRSSDGVTTQEPWGEQNAPYLDVAAPADYDGDGKADLAVFRRSDGYWHIKHSSDSAYIQTWWGLSTDTPVPGDYDGDGKADIAVWRSSNYAWYAIFSSTGVGTTLPPCGSANAPYYDIPVQADYDGDGKTDQAVWRPGTHSFLIVRSSSFQVLEVPYGQIGDTLVAKHMPNR